MAKTALIVDDLPYVRKTLAEILTQAHYQVVGEASDGPEALALYEKTRPDFITMDIVMPQMSGLEATKRILKLNPNARVIIISAMGQENLVMEAIAVGARDYLIKPFHTQEVLKTIERALMQDQFGGMARIQSGAKGL
jgi:two-component system chemotaxis response regulator CheY